MKVSSGMKGLLIVGLILLAVALQLTSSASAQNSVTPAAVNSSVKHFVVVVTWRGFNGTDGPLNLNLTQGDFVHITFLYGDGELAYDNPHVIFLRGYDLRTDVISKLNPVSTLEFVASKSGIFAFYCVIPCQGMTNLEAGTVNVVPSPSGTIPTAIDIMVENEPVQGEPSSLMAKLSQNSEPIPDVHIDFYVNTTFGPMRIGNVMTDQYGVARISYTFGKSGQALVIVRFAGTSSLAGSSAQLEFSVEPRVREPVAVSIIPGPSGGSMSVMPYVRGQNVVPDIRFVGVPLASSVPIITVILLIVGSVWATYAYVFVQIRALTRGSPKQNEKEEFGGERKLESTTQQPKKGFDKRVLLGVLLVAVVVVGLVAFQYTSSPQSQPQTVTFKIDIKMLMQGSDERHVFDPATITVHKGDHVILIVTNTDDDSIHGVIIPELNLNTGPLKGDESAKLEFNATQTGTFTILCPVPGCAPDHDLMIGQLVVQ